METNDIADLKLKIGFDRAKQNYILTGATSSDGVEYVDVDHSKLIGKQSKRTVWRRIEKMKSINGYKKVVLPFYFECQGKYFVSKYLFAQNKKKKRKQRMNDKYVEWLKTIHWDIAGCVRYKEDISLNTIVRRLKVIADMMYGLTYGKGLMFYALEKNPGSPNSYHAHYVIGYNGKHDYEKMSGLVGEVLIENGKHYEAETWMEKYNPDEAYLNYMLKEVDFKDGNYDIVTGEEHKSEYLP